MARSLIWVLAALIALVNTHDADACKTPPPCVALQSFPTEAEAERGLTEQDPVILARSLVTIARAGDPKRLTRVQKLLLDGRIAKQIHDAPDGRRCLLPAVLRAFAEGSLGQFTFVALINAKAWNDDGDLTDALLRASGALKKGPADVVAFWKKYSKPEDGYINLTTMALIENGSAEALELFENLFTDPKHEVETRKGWLHTTFIEQRHQPRVLAMVKRLLATKLPAPHVAAVGEATFVVRQRWYGTCPGPTPPAASSYTPEARTLVKQLATTVRANKPDAELAKAITRLLAELDKP